MAVAIGDLPSTALAPSASLRQRPSYCFDLTDRRLAVTNEEICRPGRPRQGEFRDASSLVAGCKTLPLGARPHLRFRG